ncbi:MAG: AGE family epimerase/isomerase [Spirochaetales bacterium]|nr:AGE family epimerase/isomerase [Spirochaetales bacterium]
MESIEKLKIELEKELHNNILSYAMKRSMDRKLGGFYGKVDFNGKVHPEEEKSTVMIGRYLWTFSRAYRVFHNPEYLEAADHAYSFLSEYLLDKEYGGFYWSVSPDGKPLQTHKHAYAQAFGLYGFSEYAAITNDMACLDEAEKLFGLMTRNLYDKEYGGFIETLGRDWTAEDSIALSDKDLVCSKTMNTNLHVLEALTNLHKYFPEAGAGPVLGQLVEIYIKKVVNPQTNHLELYFNKDWTPVAGQSENLFEGVAGSHIHHGPVSYGHDIESVWLLTEAIELLKEDALAEGWAFASEARSAILKVAGAALSEGFDQQKGYLYNEFEKGHIENSSIWWVQAEAMVGLVYTWEITGEPKYYKMMEAVWNFIKNNHISEEGRGWYWGIDSELKPLVNEQTSGNWKTCYHNGRMIMEILDRIKG